jgi:hypothetical protein
MSLRLGKRRTFVRQDEIKNPLQTGFLRYVTEQRYKAKGKKIGKTPA